MTEQNNPAHWCKAVIEQAVQPSKVGVAATPWNYQTTGNYQANTYSTNPQAGIANYSGYGGVISSNPLSSTSGQGITSVTSPVIGSFPPPPMYSNPAANMFYTTAPPSSISTGYPQYGYPSTTLQPQATTTTSWPSYTAAAVKPQYNQPNMSKPMVYQPPQMNISNANMKPNPARFANMSMPTTIVADPENFKRTATAPASSSAAAALADSTSTLKNFIKRSFSICGSDKEKAMMQAILGKLVAKIKNDNELDTYDWDNEPIPNMYDVNVQKKNPMMSAPAAQTVSMTTMASNQDTKKRKSRFEPDNNGNIMLSNGFNDDVTSSKKVKNGAQVINIPGKPILEASLTPEESNMRQHRASRFQYDTKATSSISTATTSKASKKKESASSKKLAQAMKNRLAFTSSESSTDFDLESLKIIGTCQVLEKDYFRLTSAPDPSTVRPMEVLKRSLALIKRKWKNNDAEYIYICSQLKAVRQDLTVQNIRNDFMAEVYETHARIALECGDLNEYNQCQTQLKQLYDSGISGAEMEFTAYRILYYVYLQGNKKYQNGSSDLSGILISLSQNAKDHPAVIHALSVRQAIRRENYHRFFQLYKVTPNMGAYILDHMLDGLRLLVLVRMCKAYKPHIPVLWLIDELGFDDKHIGEAFLVKAGCVVSESSESEKMVMTAESVIDSAAVLTQDKLLL